MTHGMRTVTAELLHRRFDSRLVMAMAAAQVVGNDVSVGWGGAAGSFELNVMIPVMAFNLLQSVAILSSGCRLFASRCIEGIEADEARCLSFVEQSLALVTPLTSRIGYDAAAAIAKESVETGRTVRELCLEKKVLPPDELARLLDARAMTGK